jgi:ABC-type uncharacterized transport system substrate-binding protein
MLERFPTRTWIAALALLGTVVSPAAAQQLPKIGFVSGQGHALEGHIKHFKDGMTAFGHSEGKTYELEVHFTGANQQQTRDAIQKLVNKPVDVLVAWVTPVAHMAKEATQDHSDRHAGLRPNRHGPGAEPLPPRRQSYRHGDGRT